MLTLLREGLDERFIRLLAQWLGGEQADPQQRLLVPALQACVTASRPSRPTHTDAPQ